MVNNDIVFFVYSFQFTYFIQIRLVVYSKWESNPHTRNGYQILSLKRLPIPPFELIKSLLFSQTVGYGKENK